MAFTIFSMEDHILKVLRKDKGTVLKNNRGNSGKAAGACVRAWANSGNISTRCSLMKRTDSDDHVFEVTFEHIVDSQTHRPHHNWSKRPHLCTLCKWCSLITWLHHWIQGGLLLKAIFMPEPKKTKNCAISWKRHQIFNSKNAARTYLKYFWDSNFQSTFLKHVTFDNIFIFQSKNDTEQNSTICTVV